MKTQEKNIALKLSNIELLGAELHAHPDYIPKGKHTFEISLESRLDTQKKEIAILVVISILDGDTPSIIGSLTSRFIYFIQDFDKIIVKEASGNYNVPDKLQRTINRISISSSRGMLFSAFKGTILHNALLPVLDIE